MDLCNMLAAWPGCCTLTEWHEPGLVSTTVLEEPHPASVLVTTLRLWNCPTASPLPQFQLLFKIMMGYKPKLILNLFPSLYAFYMPRLIYSSQLICQVYTVIPTILLRSKPTQTKCLDKGHTTGNTWSQDLTLIPLTQGPQCHFHGLLVLEYLVKLFLNKELVIFFLDYRASFSLSFHTLV